MQERAIAGTAPLSRIFPFVTWLFSSIFIEDILTASPALGPFCGQREPGHLKYGLGGYG
jgi:hypothetical protein